MLRIFWRKMSNGFKIKEVVVHVYKNGSKLKFCNLCIVHIHLCRAEMTKSSLLMTYWCSLFQQHPEMNQLIIYLSNGSNQNIRMVCNVHIGARVSHEMALKHSWIDWQRKMKKNKTFFYSVFIEHIKKSMKFIVNYRSHVLYSFQFVSVRFESISTHESQVVWLLYIFISFNLIVIIRIETMFDVHSIYYGNIPHIIYTSH